MWCDMARHVLCLCLCDLLGRAGASLLAVTGADLNAANGM